MTTDETIYSNGLVLELGFWNHFLHVATTDTSSYFNAYLSRRLDIGLPLHLVPSSMLPELDVCEILDVGSGPFPFLGRVLFGRKINICAVDKLANEYRNLYLKYGIFPPTIPMACNAECLCSFFADKKFDLVYARNSIDHTKAPLKCIQEMISVSRYGVLLEHKVNEGKVENYEGLHQWNFFERDGKFLIGDIKGNSICVNDNVKVESMECSVTTEEEEGIKDWLVVRIKI